MEAISQNHGGIRHNVIPLKKFLWVCRVKKLLHVYDLIKIILKEKRK